jgi:hypothetical protein
VIFTVLSAGIFYAVFHGAVSKWPLRKHLEVLGAFMLGSFVFAWFDLMRAHKRAVNSFIAGHDPLADWDRPVEVVNGVAVRWEVSLGDHSTGWLSLENRRAEPLVVDGLGGGGARGLGCEVVTEPMRTLPPLPEVAAQTMVAPGARVRVTIDLTPMLAALGSGGYRLRFSWKHTLGREPASLHLGDETLFRR